VKARDDSYVIGNVSANIIAGYLVCEGSLHDRDLHAGQHHVPLAVLPLPDHRSMAAKSAP
jgi:hypothetical protein